MRIQPLDPPIARPSRPAVQSTAPPLDSARLSGHERAPRPSTLVRTAERIADHTLTEAKLPELGGWDAGHFALVRAIIAELSMVIDVAEQATGR